MRFQLFILLFNEHLYSIFLKQRKELRFLPVSDYTFWLFFKFFFPKFFFQHFFTKIFFFEGFTGRCPFAETKRTLCICVIKNMLSKRSKLDFVLCDSSSVHISHITLDIKSLIPSSQRIIYYYILFRICYI